MMDEEADFVDTVSASEDEDDEKSHARLLDAISSLDGKKVNKRSQRTVPSNEVSEFHFKASSDDSKVKLHELMGTLKTSARHGSLKTKLNKVQNQKVVPVPLPKHQKEKIERGVAYSKTAKEISKWDPVVRSNREAEQLQFPLQKTEIHLHNNTGKFSHFKPRTPLEMEIAAVLHGNKDDLPTQNKELTPAEERIIAAMSLEEAKERRAELQKFRALMSYKEAKAKRQKRIKSKKFHRIMKKDKLKQEKRAFEELQKNDPEAYNEKLEEAERQRIEERMSLKHRGGSKYAKKQMLYAKFDDQARQRVQDMLQKSRELTQKVVPVSDSEEEEEAQIDSEEEMMKRELAALSSNPWMKVQTPAAPTKSEFSRPEVMLNSEGQEEDRESERSESEEEGDVLKKMGRELKKKKQQIQEVSQMVSNVEEGIDEIFQKLEDKAQDEEKKVEVFVMEDAKGSKRKKKRRKKKNKEEKLKDEGEKEEVEDVPLISEGLKRKKTLEDLEEDDAESEEDIPIYSRTAVPNTDSISSEDTKTGEVNIDPKKIITLETKLSDVANPDVTTGDNEEESDEEETQRSLIAQAFAEDDVVDEFVKEKNAIIDRDKPKDLDLFLPGWGSWGGEGVKVSKKKRKKFLIKAPEGPPRRDDKLGNVIISEKKDKAISKHQVSDLPFPYVSVDQYEQSIRAPIGKTWNPETAVRELVKPKVVTKLGSIIEPINKADGPELLRQVFLERGWIEFDEDSQEDYDWNIWWRTSRFRNCDYDNIQKWQRLNHYPKSTGITKKDCLARNLKRMKGVHGAGVYNFCPMTFNLPNDYTRFVAEYSKLKQKQNDSKTLYWICKPADMSRGRGIFIFSDISDLQYDCNAVLQRYISNPLLIGGYKFDVRIYVAVPSFHPLTIYIYEEGIVRFGTEKFDLSALHNVFAHLTNTSINKHSPAYTTDKERIGPGCKWTLTQLRYYFHQNHIDDSVLWIRVMNLIILTVLVQAPQVPKVENCFELYGFDVLIDENLKPWLLEVNFSPSLSSDCQSDIIVKKPLLHDLMDLMHFKEQDKERGGEAFRQMTSRSKALETDRYSSVSRTGRNSAMHRSTSNFQKSLSALSKQQSTVKESTSYIEQDNEAEKQREAERMCFGLPLVNPTEDEKRPGSASSGVSSAGSEKLEEVEKDLKPRIPKSASAGQLHREKSRTSVTFSIGPPSARSVVKTPSLTDVNNNHPTSQSVIHTTIGPVQTVFVRRSSTLSSNSKSQRAEKASIKSSATSDSAISSLYSGSGSENSDLVSLPEDSRRRPKNMVSSQRRPSYTYGQTNDSITNLKSNKPSEPKSTLPSSSSQPSSGIKSLRPNGNSNALRKISSSGTVTPKPSLHPQRTLSRVQQMNYDVPSSQREARSSLNQINPQRNQPRRFTPANESQAPFAKVSLRKSQVSRMGEQEGGHPTRRSINGSRMSIRNRTQLNSQQGRSKIKGPPSRVGSFYLAFPFNEVTYKTANGTLDAHVVIRESQKILREVLHNVDKAKGEKKSGGYLPFGAKEDSEQERLWPPVKPPPEVT
ncbi:uncharacterized protein LOC134266461 [Saccostrea cucullata]|uniref:uncharacterized protein LOC134266461 n=1 Tax=Saccostrea cuccullata TaxID=36930 RepID=UPI002ED022BB